MAELDVSGLLADADFSDDFSVIRNVQVVDATGIATAQPQTYSTYGVVGPASGAQLQLLPDEQRTEAAIRVITPFPLTPPTETTEADLVAWQGRFYRVTLLNPYTNWGNGFSDATCTLTDYTLPAPLPPDPSTTD